MFPNYNSFVFFSPPGDLKHSYVKKKKYKYSEIPQILLAADLLRLRLLEVQPLIRQMQKRL